MIVDIQPSTNLAFIRYFLTFLPQTKLRTDLCSGRPLLGSILSVTSSIKLLRNESFFISFGCLVGESPSCLSSIFDLLLGVRSTSLSIFIFRFLVVVSSVPFCSLDFLFLEYF